MDRSWKQLLAALLLGLVMPQAVLNIGAPHFPEQTQPQQTLAPEQTDPQQTQEPTQEPTAEPTQPPQTVPQLPILTKQGIVNMSLEDYVLGVVLAEMPASFESEALKAQAVAARTYAMRRCVLSYRHDGAALCVQASCCQAYVDPQNYLSRGGSQQNLDKVRSAVNATALQVLTYNGLPADTTYFSCSGGRTEDAQAVWGGSVPYLQAVDSPGEEISANFSKTVRFSAEEFVARLGRTITGSPETWFGSASYTPGGGVASILIGGISYTGTTLRRLLQLNSTAFTVQADSTGISITTSGYGHRVGMSQYGAQAMASTGSTYEQILAHYYRGTNIDKTGAVG